MLYAINKTQKHLTFFGSLLQELAQREIKRQRPKKEKKKRFVLLVPKFWKSNKKVNSIYQQV